MVKFGNNLCKLGLFLVLMCFSGALVCGMSVDVEIVEYVMAIGCGTGALLVFVGGVILEKFDSEELDTLSKV